MFLLPVNFILSFFVASKDKDTLPATPQDSNLGQLLLQYSIWCTTNLPCITSLNQWAILSSNQWAIHVYSIPHLPLEQATILYDKLYFGEKIILWFCIAGHRLYSILKLLPDITRRSSGDFGAFSIIPVESVRTMFRPFMKRSTTTCHN